MLFAFSMGDDDEGRRRVDRKGDYSVISFIVHSK